MSQIWLVPAFPLLGFILNGLLGKRFGTRFVTFARSMDSMTGVVFIFFIIVVAAAEAVVGLSIILSIFRTRKTLNIDEFNFLKW